MLTERGHRHFAAIVVTALTIAVGGLLADPAGAQNAASGEVKQGPGQQVPFQAQPSPPSLTPEQQRRREEALGQTHLRGPTLPDEPGHPRQSPEVAPTPPPAGVPKTDATPRQNDPQAAGTYAFRFFAKVPNDVYGGEHVRSIARTKVKVVKP
jgi:hypothetical protein